MTDPNTKALEQARRNIADEWTQPYQVRAILAGSWDAGKLVQDEMTRLLKQPMDGVE